MLIEKSLKKYIEETASSSPTPGGGSVAALVGSLGGALTNMVGNLTFGKKQYDELPPDIQESLNENFKEIERLTEELKVIIDTDATAFDGVMEAFKMPKETEEEKKARSEKIQEGYKHALEVPLSSAEKCLEILKLQNLFALYGNINAITDVGVGTLLAYSGLEGSLFNVSINLLSIKDQDYRIEKENQAKDLLEKGAELRDELLEIVYKRLES